MPQQTADVVGCNFVDGDLFKATLLWEKIITHLEKSIKCGRHTQALRSYTNCFQGSKAVDCLLVHLNFVLRKTVRRHQVQTLCNKLLLTGVIEDVRDKDKGVFREGRLYRLTKNHFWASPAERKLPRTRSAEEICTTEKESDMDEKGYASDSTVGGHQSGSKSSSMSGHKKKKSKEKEREAQKSHSRFHPSSSGMLRMKSTGSIFSTPESTPTSALCESQENLLSDAKPRRRHVSSSCRRPSRLDPGHNNTLLGTRRASVDSGSTRFSKPPLHSRRSSRSGRDEMRHSGKEKERPIRTRRLSRSLKEESERTLGQDSLDFPAIKSSNRSHSCSSVGGDYDEGGASPAAVASPSTPDTPLVSVTPASPGVGSSNNKWIVYGFV